MIELVIDIIDIGRALAEHALGTMLGRARSSPSARRGKRTGSNFLGFCCDDKPTMYEQHWFRPNWKEHYPSPARRLSANIKE